MNKKHTEDQSKLGFAFLGSGGGGSIKLGVMLLDYLKRQSLSYDLVKTDNIDDNHNLVFTAFVGPPSIANEKLPSLAGGLTAIKAVEKSLDKKVHGVITLEIGGTNGMYGLFLSGISQNSDSKKYVIDADAMGRAYPSATLITPFLFDNAASYFPLSIWLATDTVSEKLFVDNLESLDQTWINWTMTHGGIATLAFLPMTGAKVKELIDRQHLINNSISTAFSIGTALEDYRMGKTNRISELNNQIKECDAPYENFREVLHGKIIKVKVRPPTAASGDTEATLDEGLITIRDSNDTSKEVVIVYKNEYLGLYDLREEEYTVTTPTIISIMDPDLTPITADCAAEGQKVKVMTLAMRESIFTPRALDIIGPKSTVFGLYSKALLAELKSASAALKATPTRVKTTYYSPCFSTNQVDLPPQHRLTPSLKTQSNESSLQKSLNLCLSIDVGGTHTDVVLRNEDGVIHAVKSKTYSGELCKSIKQAIEALFEAESASRLKPYVSQINIGTTTFVNAALKATRIETVLPIRIASPFGDFHPPLCNWPDDIKHAVGGGYLLVKGRVNYDGTIEENLDLEAITAALEQKLKEKETVYKNIVITSMNATKNSELEETLRQYLTEKLNLKQRIVCSHIIPCIGIIERENSSILNAALSSQYEQFVKDVKKAITQLGISAKKIYMSQNDGTASSPETTLPILTFKSGPSNSIRGVAAVEEFTNNAIVIDIGGTTSDCGAYQDRYPVCSSLNQTIFGIECRLPGPVVNSIEIGGNSLLFIDSSTKKCVQIGGKRPPHMPTDDNPITLTDLAITNGYFSIEGRQKVADIEEETNTSAVELVHKHWAEQIEKQIPLLSDKVEFDIILVGGGAKLCNIKELRKHLLKLSSYKKIIDIRHLALWAGYANAIGAGIANIQAKDTIRLNNPQANKDKEIRKLERKLTTIVTKNGADPESIKCTAKEVSCSYENTKVLEITVTCKGRPAHQLITRAGRPKSLSFSDQPPGSPSPPIMQHQPALGLFGKPETQISPDDMANEKAEKIQLKHTK